MTVFSALFFLHIFCVAFILNSLYLVAEMATKISNFLSASQLQSTERASTFFYCQMIFEADEIPKINFSSRLQASYSKWVKPMGSLEFDQYIKKN